MSVMFLSRDLDLLSFDPKIHGFPGLIVEHFCVKFGDLFIRYRAENRHTDKRK